MLRTVLMLAVLSVLSACAATGEQTAGKLLTRHANAIVSIETMQPIVFDNGGAGVNQGTGFVVDKARGIILSNRHVIGAGPNRHRITFHDGTSLDASVLWIDPVHDFGFLQYDPAQLQPTDTDVSQLKLVQGKVDKGTQVTIIGNDSGERYVVHQGTISRNDRIAPDYGTTESDFNTWYIVAATDTNGGSSGAPVFNNRGQVIALNAGAGRETDLSYFLPVDYPRWALDKLQRNQPVPRGSLLTVFDHYNYQGLQQFNLPEPIWQQLKQEMPRAGGLMVISQVIPGSPAASVLSTGDIVTRINGVWTHNMYMLMTLDQLVGQEVDVEYIHHGQVKNTRLPVTDLDALRANEYLSIEQAIMMPVTPQIARTYHLPLEGILLADSGFFDCAACMRDDLIIYQVNGRPMRSIADLRLALEQHSGKNITVEVAPARDRRELRSYTVDLSRDWFDDRHCRLAELQWHCEPLSLKPLPSQSLSQSAARVSVAVDPLAEPMVRVSFARPFGVAAQTHTNSSGVGLVVDAERGWVVTSRFAVDTMLGEVTLTLANGIELGASVKAIHPLFDLTLLEVAASERDLLPAAPVLATSASPGDTLRAIYFDGRHVTEPVEIQAIVNRMVTWIKVGEQQLSGVNQPYVWLSQDKKLPGLAYHMPTEESSPLAGMIAQYGDMTLVISAETIAHFVNDIRQEHQVFYAPGVALNTHAYPEAIELGLDQAWLQRYTKLGAEPNQLLFVSEVLTAETQLRQGDVLLSVDGELITNPLQLYQQKATQQYQVLRDREVVTLDVNNHRWPYRDIEQVVLWAGMTIHKANPAVVRNQHISPDCLLISSYRYGSPAHLHQAYAGRCLLEVNGQPLYSLNQLVRVLEQQVPDQDIQLLLADIEGNHHQSLVSLKPDPELWPLRIWEYQSDRCVNELSGRWQLVSGHTQDPVPGVESDCQDPAVAAVQPQDAARQ